MFLKNYDLIFCLFTKKYQQNAYNSRVVHRKDIFQYSGKLIQFRVLNIKIEVPAKNYIDLSKFRFFFYGALMTIDFLGLINKNSIQFNSKFRCCCKAAKSKWPLT
jgi:hypothetical protein